MGFSRTPEQEKEEQRLLDAEEKYYRSVDAGTLSGEAKTNEKKKLDDWRRKFESGLEGPSEWLSN